LARRQVPLFTELPSAKVFSESPLTHESIKLVWL
jgi:hypothetical protein